MNLIDPLEIGGDGLELNSEPAIAGDGEAVLPHHRNQSRSIVLKNRHDWGFEIAKCV